MREVMQPHISEYQTSKAGTQGTSKDFLFLDCVFCSLITHSCCSYRRMW